MKELKYKHIEVLGYKIFSSSMEECLQYIFTQKKINIISGNPEVLYTGLQRGELYENFTSDEALIIPDGVGTQIAGRILKTPVKEKIAGIEVMKSIIERCEKTGEGIYLLGATEESLYACVANLLRDYPKLKIVGYRDGFFNMDKPTEIIEDIKAKKPKALFVAMGCPRQELFISRYIDFLPADIFMGVGGSFDVIGEKVKRAPRWMINIGMEWAYRVSKEPWRIKRLGSIPKFLLLVIRAKGVRNER